MSPPGFPVGAKPPPPLGLGAGVGTSVGSSVDPPPGVGAGPGPRVGLVSGVGVGWGLIVGADPGGSPSSWHSLRLRLIPKSDLKGRRFVPPMLLPLKLSFK